MIIALVEKKERKRKLLFFFFYCASRQLYAPRRKKGVHISACVKAVENFFPDYLQSITQRRNATHTDTEKKDFLFTAAELLVTV